MDVSDQQTQQMLGLGLVGQPAPFGCGVDLAVEADEFGSEQFDVGPSR